MEACREGEDAAQAAKYILCLGYIHGLVDGYIVGMMVLDQQTKAPRTPICLPDWGIEAGTAVDLTLAWLTRHPDSRDETARMAVFRAMVAAYPCQAPVQKK